MTPGPHASPQREPAATTAQRVLRAQVAALFGSLTTSVIAGTLLACALSGIFYWQLRDPMALLWLGLVLLSLPRHRLSVAYQHDTRAAERSEHWARLRDRELLIYSGLWALAPWIFMPQSDIAMTVLMMLIILGLSSGGLPAVAHRWETAVRFIVPMVVSLILALAWRADAVHGFLAICTTVYLGATLHFARLQHRLLTDALLTRFEKDALVEELAQQVTISERASKEKTRFLASASHDLRQPLHAIALFGAVLQKELQGHPQHAIASRLMRAVNALGTSLDTMLDISRLDAGVIVPQISPVPLNPLLQAVNQMFASRADQKDLQLRVRASPLWVRTDPELLQRLLVNLVENAIKYTTRGGVLVVARQRGSMAWIDVCDTGVGIPPEQQEHIFDEFYQVSNPGRDRSQGLGIGLSIVRRLSQLLDHPVQVHSRPGHGSRFRVALPTAVAHVTPSAGSGLTEPEQATDMTTAGELPRRVLMIDDEADIGDAISALLRVHGSQLHVVRDENSAAIALSEATEPFQAMLCDYRLADGADGLAVAQRLRSRFAPDLPLLLVTGETAPERLKTLRDSGVPVLFKPVPARLLLQTLQEVSSMKVKPGPF